MIFTVATISPTLTGRNAGKVAKVMASSTAFTRIDARPVEPKHAARFANRLARPVKGGSMRMPSPASLRASAAAASSSCTSSRSSLRRDESLDAGRLQLLGDLGRDARALAQDELARPHRMG